MPDTPPTETERAADPELTALAGNPNVGKTTLYNKLCGLKQHTSNVPGTTQDAHIGTANDGQRLTELYDGTVVLLEAK